MSEPRCPVTPGASSADRVDLSTVSWPSVELTQCPYPFYDALRAEAPVHRLPGREEYLVSRWADIAYVAEHPEVFGQVRRNESEPTDEPHTPWKMSDTDAPDHWPKRTLGLRMVTRDRLREYRPLITGIVDELIDGFADHGSVEFYTQFAEPLPIIVMADILGLPRSDLPSLQTWSRSDSGTATRYLSAEQQHVQHVNARDVAAYMRQAIEDRVAAPREDFLTEMIQAQVDRDGALALRYLTSEATLLLRAGNVTTTHMLASMMLLLVQHPEAMASVVADPGLIRALVEESLRVETPIQYVDRLARCDTEIDGVAIPAGATVIMVLASGNRDERKFEDPARFDPERRHVVKHQLAFGRGAHHCLGAPLARLEGEIAFERLLTRLQDIRPVSPDQPTTYIDSLGFRAPGQVNVRFHRAEVLR